MDNIRTNDSDIVFVRFIVYYFKYGYVCGGVGGWVGMYTWVQILSTGRCTRPLETGVLHGCELPGIGTGTSTWVFWKNSKCFYLSISRSEPNLSLLNIGSIPIKYKECLRDVDSIWSFSAAPSLSSTRSVSPRSFWSLYPSLDRH